MVVWAERVSDNTDGANSWTTATRPSSPFTGQTGINTDFGGLEMYNGSGWMVMSGTWTTATRPTSIVAGSQGYNSDTGMGQEFYDGSNWRLLG